MIDSTVLGTDVERELVAKVCEEAAQTGFFAVCINPTHVRYTAGLLDDTTVKVCAVVGFPTGAHTRTTKVFEANDAAQRGADEIDMVINISALLHGYEKFVYEEIRDVVKVVEGRPVKAIIETGLLTDKLKIEASKIVADAGAHFVKTCTGFTTGKATDADVRLIKSAVGDSCGVKASGGIGSWNKALSLIEAGATRIGSSSAGVIMDGLDFAVRSGKIE